LSIKIRRMEKCRLLLLRRKVRPNTCGILDKSELFIAKMRLEQVKQEQKEPRKIKSKIAKISKKIRGGKKKNDKR